MNKFLFILLYFRFIFILFNSILFNFCPKCGNNDAWQNQNYQWFMPMGQMGMEYNFFQQVLGSNALVVT